MTISIWCARAGAGRSRTSAGRRVRLAAVRKTDRALSGVRVLDLSRVLAGPWATQALGDLGADVVKIEQPGVGDDTRRWGPPFLQDGSGDSAYYLCANRNKQSLAVDMAAPEGAALLRR